MKPFSNLEPFWQNQICEGLITGIFTQGKANSILDKAKYSETSEKITVWYENGFTDDFYKYIGVVHTSDTEQDMILTGAKIQDWYQTPEGAKIWFDRGAKDVPSGSVWCGQRPKP